MAGLRFDPALVGQQIGQLAPVSPEPQIGQRTTGGLDANVGGAADGVRHRQPEGALLPIGQSGGEQFAGPRESGRRLAIVERRQHERHTPAGALSKRQTQLVGADIQNLVEPAILRPGGSRDVGRTGQHVDQLQRRAALAVRSDRKPAGAGHMEQGLALFGHRQARHIQLSSCGRWIAGSGNLGVGRNRDRLRLVCLRGVRRREGGETVGELARQARVHPGRFGTGDIALAQPGNQLPTHLAALVRLAPHRRGIGNRDLVIEGQEAG